jgi:hypothetical protein
MGSWRRLVRNLFTNDKALLQDLMGVFLTARRSAVLVCSKAIIRDALPAEQLSSVGASSGLNLFTTARQEMEMRGRLLKRIAFALYCCKKACRR